jgi:hypothetical protein
MGNVTDSQYAIKTWEKGETEGVTNHAPETTNRNPENLKDGERYPAFYPENGVVNIKVIDTVQGLCDFTNEWRKKGYPMDVNPRYLWLRDRGDLFIPSESTYQGIKMDWENFSKAYSNSSEATSDEDKKEVMNEILSKFLEFLHFDVSSELIYAKRSDSDSRYDDVVNDSKKTFNKFRKNKLQALQKDLKGLVGELDSTSDGALPVTSDVGQFINKYFEWRKQERSKLKKERPSNSPSPNSSDSDISQDSSQDGHQL